MFPVSGTNALLGEESWRGAQIATDLRNRAGGIAGKKVELVFADIPDVAAAASEARRLVFKEKTRLGIGAYGSSLALAASEVYYRTGHSYVELGAVSEAVTGRGYENVFRMNPTAKDMVVRHMDFIENYLAGALGKPVSELRVVMLHEDSSYGQSIIDLAKAEAATIGINDFMGEAYSATSTDLSSTVFRLAEKKPDIVLAVSYASDAVLLARQIRDNNVKLGAFVGTGGGHSLKSFHDAVGNLTDGVFDVDYAQININPDYTPGIKDFVDSYRQLHGNDPASGHSMANFSGANLVFDILERAEGDDSPEAFRDAARGFELPPASTAAGWGFKLDDKNQNTRGEMYVMQWKDGELDTVWPPEAAVRRPETITPFGL